MYESPVRIFETEPNVIMRDIAKKMTENFDDAVMMEIQHTYHIDVDKDELVRALKYDRGQYDKGYKDGYDYALQQFADFMKEKFGLYLIRSGEDIVELKKSHPDLFCLGRKKEDEDGGEN